MDAMNHTSAIATLHCSQVLVCVLKYALTPSRLNIRRGRPVYASHLPDLVRHLFKVLDMEVPGEVLVLVGHGVPLLALLLQRDDQGLTVCRVKSNVTAVTSLFAARRSEAGVGRAYHHRRHSWYRHCVHPTHDAPSPCNLSEDRTQCDTQTPTPAHPHLAMPSACASMCHDKRRHRAFLDSPRMARNILMACHSSFQTTPTRPHAQTPPPWTA